jgi:IS4 transposase
VILLNKRKGITYVLNCGGHVLVRFHSRHLPLFTRRGTRFPVLDRLRSLEEGEHGDWDVWYLSPEKQEMIKGRLCAIRKSKEAIELSKKKVRREASRDRRRLKPETLEYAEYFIVFTTMTRYRFNGRDALGLYGIRWQIELVFKRLKSIIGLGHLPKHNPDSCRAWLCGKMFVALLVERLYQEAEFFSPWGYPI